MQRFIPLSVLLLILGYACYNRNSRTQHTSKPVHPILHGSTSDTTQTSSRYPSLKAYIIHVINHGSSQLHFKDDEIMEGGYAPSEDAPGIACYVLSLAGEQCAYPPEAAGYYSSICGGCHGDDAKGLNGTYPDLTRRPLLGWTPPK